MEKENGHDDESSTNQLDTHNSEMRRMGLELEMVFLVL